jgi:hypothetical protein
MTMQIEIPETTDLRTTGKDWLVAAKTYEVVDQPSLTSANEALRQVRLFRKQVEEKLEPAIRAAHTAHRQMTQLRNELAEPFERAEAEIKRRIGTYLTEQERLARVERERAEAAARKAAEEESLQRAMQLEKQGRVAEAAAEIATPISVAVEPTAPAVEKPKGLGTRENWSARVDSLLALVQFVAANPAYVNLLVPNQQALNDLARAQKAALSIPGVTAQSSTTVVSR